jgi:hypothetical protein
LSGEGLAIATGTETRLGADTLPLVLLAALTHPERALRLRLLARLDNAIEERRPLHSESVVRAFLAHCTELPPLAREVAVRVVRLTFARRTHGAARRWVFLGTGSRHGHGGLAVTNRLEVLRLRRFVQNSGPTYRRGDPRLLLGRLEARLRGLSPAGAVARATCRAEDGFCLSLSSDLPWSRNLTRISPEGWLAGTALAALGLTAQRDGDLVRIRTTTPESIIRFSAALARGEYLEVCRHFVALHDFDGDEAELPVLTCWAHGERWLQGLPALTVELGAEDVIALAAWAYLPEDWIDQHWDWFGMRWGWRGEEVLDRVFAERAALDRSAAYPETPR